MRKTLLLGVLLVAAALLLVALSPGVAFAGAPAPAPVCTDRSLQGGPEEPLATETLFLPRLMSPCGNPVVREVPFQDDWANSPHNDKESEAFVHWDNTGVIPANCAKCHSSTGYQDYIGVDGTPNSGNVASTTHGIGTTVDCVACHNNVTLTKTSVGFPSGITIEDLGDESRCIECHQGRSSGPTIQSVIDKSAIMAADPDAVDPAVSAQNNHYFAAAATQYGTMVKGGYEYEDMAYDVKFAHVEGVDTCYTCHDMHTLEIKYEACVDCHPGVEDAEDLAAIRTPGSRPDYDGDGNTTEGVDAEIAGLEGLLYGAIQQYAKQVSGTCLVYDGAAYPYVYVDVDCNGVKDAADTAQFKAFTARLLKAVYNYQVAIKDPGKHAHGGKYMIELLYDSIADLNNKISTPVDMSKLHRTDAGHFNSSSMGWRDWDEPDPGSGVGTVSATCARCHSAAGLPLIVSESSSSTGLPPVTVSAGNTFPITIKQPVASSMMCTTCHKTLGPTWELLEVKKVVFPSGAALTFADAADVPANACMTCHAGRNSTVSVDVAIGATADDAQMANQSFINIHYASSGATLFGNDTKGIYQYAGKTYKGAFAHLPTFNSCIECHGEHGLTLRWTASGANLGCTSCHAGAATPEDIRMGGSDWDGDGNLTEGVAHEIDGLAELLYTDMKAYAATTAGAAIVFSGGNFYVDVNGNGVRDPEDTTRYNKWTPKLMRAGYNYNYLYRETGAYGHNAKYVIQALYDGLESFGHNMTGLTRPS